MANWAITDYVIEGPEETLKKINDAILEHPVRKDSSDDWEGNILLALGIDWENERIDGTGCYVRGFIQDKPEFTGDTLSFYAEEAWGLTDFYWLLGKAFPDIKVYWKVEEPGMGIYATNDREGRHFPERYYVDMYCDGEYGSEYFEDEEEMYMWLSNHTSDKIKSKEDVEKYNKEHEDDDYYIVINEFKIEE